ncbi:uncharacterized protein BO87DRAFT_451169 [Aspergillus neoniger CBS 115656]|uniref:Uncharacterized protein n=1 Tax=Aspergillus neoniger (strain CBS 115656) TaxID=1448310 RepID=A0A318Y428_ASPNB|nr:hypothetical protein BO87DRAFT_451169 [Aspergillus neoniger CBS 115656]PYH28569.1 hypothetical protein BO87DRAFT_451169 [Aspergillus neoniger CBS 115656]
MSKANIRAVPWTSHLIYLLLILPTGLSITLLLSDSQHWTLTGNLYTFINHYRTTVQTALQIIATLLGAIQILSICRLINHATRILFKHSTHHTTLNDLALWSALSTPTTNFSLPLPQIILTLLLANLSAVLSALWTGALTPTSTTTTANTTILIPSYANRSFIKEYPSQIDTTGPSLRTSLGYFTYSVGVGLLTSLVSSASTASPLTGSLKFRSHAKLDSTGYTYSGRSYGVGSPVGLTDGNVTSSYPYAANYTYHERGYLARVSCIYNSSTLFLLGDTYDTALYVAEGPLPDSNASTGEYSTYTGWSTDTIVALGVASQPAAYTKERYVAAAAGSYYASLNASQCLISFVPRWFLVNVAIQEKLVDVVPLNTTSSTLYSSEEETDTDIDPTNKTIHVAMRQLELISNDLTSFYRSTLGDAFNTSIADHATNTNTTANISSNFTTTSSSPNSADNEITTLTAIQNTYISLIDDILAAYGSAQLMVGNFSHPATATVTVDAFRLGSRVYIVAVFVVNVLVVIGVGIEMGRTGVWRALPKFDYLDARMLVLGGANGGRGVAERAAEVGWKGEETGRFGVRLVKVGGVRGVGWGLVYGGSRSGSSRSIEGGGDGGEKGRRGSQETLVDEWI